MLDKIAVALLLIGCSNRSEAPHEPPRPQRGAMTAAAKPVLAGATTSIELAGSTFDGQRDTELVAADRRAWRVADLVSDAARLHVHTKDGGDMVVAARDAILVRRASGEYYVGWLTAGATGALADAERPAERIERVVKIDAAPAEDVPPAVTVVVAGQQVRTLTPASFARAATTTFRDKHDRELPAIALDELIGYDAAGAHVDARPPAAGARAVLYLTHHERFKLAWLDARGRGIGERSNDITQVTLRR